MRQTESAECGLVCLAIVAASHGSKTDIAVLRRKYQLSTRGLTLKQIKEIAVDMGMAGRAIRCEIEELAALKTPAILHWGFQHFVVLTAVKGSKFKIHDPAIGERTLGLKEMSAKFTGIALELTPTTAFVKRREASPLSMSSWFRIGPAMYGALAQILLLSVFMQVYVIAVPFYMQLAVDQAALKGDSDILKALALGFGLFCVFNAGASFLRGIVTVKLTALLNWDMTLRLYTHMLRLPLPWFQRRKLADILSRFDAIGPVRDLLSGALVATLVDGLLAIATLVMMIVIAPSLALLVVGGFVAYVLVRLCALPVNMRLGMDSITARISENGKRIESIRAIQTVKVMGAESSVEGDWANRFASVVRADQKVACANLAFSSIQGLADAMVRVVLIYLGAGAIIDGNMSVGMFYAFLTYQTQFSGKAGALFEQIINWRMTDMYSHRLADIVLTPKESGIDQSIHMPEKIVGRIECANIAFAYSAQEQAIFRGISFKIEPGEFVAIVGPSGAGKSTLLKVMCGLYPASQGEIRIDGRPLSDWGPKLFRQSLGAVMQDDELLHGTVAENVAFFDDHIDMDHMWECLRQAALSKDIMGMAQRAETMIGDMGTSLSGGQKQRLLLARALYRRPQILILDEATSHLDLARESEINTVLRGLPITRVIVAHRSETIAAADRVICLDNGKITYDGPPQRAIRPPMPAALDKGADEASAMSAIAA
ncbi:peptidase domain-containing ABC transporter [Massilia sp. CCM 8734]|uniref:peptidase domain-containing ABC transporter n=1 Tax=Massilia sp. CCM 8734 TaxID=2609283 RepID=UPI001AAF21F4|nr:peptidase domain-containing ABC transporter [Massilia sp. CCM 8734]